MYVAQEEAKNCSRVFTPEMRATSLGRLSVSHRLLPVLASTRSLRHGC
jgi:hypothetical protein